MNRPTVVLTDTYSLIQTGGRKKNGAR